MKKNLCEIVCIIDRSGSMGSIKEDAIGGFNSFIDEQKKVPGEATVTLVQFDDEYELLYENKNINGINFLDDSTYVPRGMTALFDAIGKTIVSVGERLSNLEERDRPEKVIFAILTDGYENSSKEYTTPSVIKEMIEHQKEKYSWDFVYLAANQDAVTTGSTFGISSKDAINFAATGSGMIDGYKCLSNSVTSYRS
jgi:hypothetical protein